MSDLVVLEQTSLFGEPESDSGGFVSAFGRRLHVEQWAHVYGVEAQTIRSRLRSGWSNDRAVSETYQETNRRLSTAFEVPWGAPGSWTWDELPYELDHWCQDFVVKHRGGALVEQCTEVFGLEDSQFRATEQLALSKLRGLVLDGDEDARALLVDMFGDAAIDTLMERFGESAVCMDDADDDDGDDCGPLFGGIAVLAAA